MSKKQRYVSVSLAFFRRAKKAAKERGIPLQRLVDNALRSVGAKCSADMCDLQIAKDAP